MIVSTNGDLSLEEKLLIAESRTKKREIFVKVVQRAFFRSIFISIGVIVSIFVVFYLSTLFIDIEFALFMTSGVIFFYGGIKGTVKLSPSITKAAELFGVSSKEEDYQHARIKKAFGSSIYYSVLAIFVGIHSIIVFFALS